MACARRAAGAERAGKPPKPERQKKSGKTHDLDFDQGGIRFLAAD
jgi:hypothetical protein